MEPVPPLLRPFCVVRDRVPADMAARVAARFDVLEFGAAGPGGGEAVAPLWTEALLVERADQDRLREAFGRNPFLTVEVGEGGDGPESFGDDWLGAPAVEPGFYLSLTTGTAYGLHCAPLVCDELVRRGALPPGRRSSVELCLHEAIANAIVHGNLGIPSATKSGPDGYRLFGRLLRERLGDPAVNRRRLDIFCRWSAAAIAVAVVDQGGGFDSLEAPAAPDVRAQSGRGFLFMRALASGVTVTDGGRCTVLRFDV